MPSVVCDPQTDPDQGRQADMQPSAKRVNKSQEVTQ